jgi:mycothiol system anti-sigma-R factor
MADCEETLRELETYLDGETTVEVHERVHAHLAGCLDCLHAFDFHAELKMVIAEKCHSEQLPPGLLDRIEACFGIEGSTPGEVPPV